ncbi:DUF2207 domain-containing protein [Patescibacteria group bacterium]|nr:DUF2207 domain-containing protein [Patescibacteria group bacterium]
MKKFATFLVSFLFFFALPIEDVAAQEAIGDFNVDITINQDGSVNVTEGILYSFGTSYKHGIFRRIPLLKENKDDQKFLLTIEQISVEDENKTKYEFTTSVNKEKELEIKIGDPNTKVTGQKIYVISYKVLGALTYFEDFDELYWNAIGTGWEVPINKASVNVHLPIENGTGIEVGEGDVKFSCYTGKQGSNSAECEKTYTNGVFRFKSIHALEEGEGLTIATGFPKGLVEVTEPTLYKRSLKEYLIFAGIGLVLLLGNVIIPIRKAFLLIKEKSNLNKKKRIVAAWFEPPKMPNGRYFSPGEVVGISSKISPKIITAEIIYLAQRGYIKIIEDGKKDFIFEKVKEADETFFKHQKTLYTALFGLLKNRVTIKEMKKSTSLGSRYNDMVQEIYENIKQGGFSEQNIKKLTEGNLTKAFFSFFTGGIVSFVVYTIATKIERKFTDAGIQAYSEAMSLKNFLSSQKEQLDFQAKNQMFFEKLLPYATAFGVEKILAERFMGIALQQPNWYEGNFNATQFVIISSAINNSVSKSIAASTKASSSGFSSGSSGGGFSGGGGGGGGGGSW